ncbi:MAG TPA: hypothetical protein VGM98_10690 [Schlesneria sp.]
MREVFPSWRRITGCVTLLLACAFMGMWMRSRVAVDRYSIWYSENRFFAFESRWGEIGWQDFNAAIAPEAGWTSYNSLPGLSRDHGGLAFNMIPYWSVVCPLAMLSVYLLLWKPRERGDK